MLSIRVKPIRRDLQILIDRRLSPAAQSAVFASFARQKLAEGKAVNERALGRVPPFETYVDGVEGASEDQVKLPGRILYKFDLGTDVLAQIITELERHSPVRSGRYANSHELFADGVQVDNPNDPPPAREYVIMNLTAYSRKIEGTEHSGGKRPPESSQAADGVYNVVADMMQSRFGNVALIRFSYRTFLGASILGGSDGNASSDRNPCIVVTPR